MATYIGKDTAKLKNKGGKWKYMTEKEMVDTAAPFSPYRYVPLPLASIYASLLVLLLTSFTTSCQNSKLTCLVRVLRSLFMWYMWRIEDVDISVMQNNS